jgi:SAM-dependent methyltransferase
MAKRVPMSLATVIPWGRTLREYEAMFVFGDADRASRVLDCGAGPASFAAESREAGRRVVACDPLYDHDPEAIRVRFEESVANVTAQMRASPESWVWTFHPSLEALLLERRRALEWFASDFDRGVREARYVTAALPELPFASDSFDLALSSHFLFLYSDKYTEDFHVASIRELCRVAREVRVFPILNLAQERSPHLGAVMRVASELGCAASIERAAYELQRGGNELLRIVRKGVQSET